VRGTSVDDLVSIILGARQICLCRTLPFKPISLMSTIDSGYGDVRDTSIVVSCEREGTWSLNLQTWLWCKDPHPKRKSPLQTNCSCLRGWNLFRRLSLVLSLHLMRTSNGLYWELRPLNHTIVVFVSGTLDIPKQHDFMLAHSKCMLVCLGFDSIFEIVWIRECEVTFVTWSWSAANFG